jgi:alpha-N-arabinofuranosidase
MASTVVLRTREEIGLIRPELHGHFLEHLGTATYGGIWVGRNSTVPNIGGIRKQAIADLRSLGIPVLRWPGGCFADNYHWRDGIGAPERRPRRVNLWWNATVEDNSFGTHEFMELCKLLGAAPYLAANVGSGTPAEGRDWLEYCNFPSGSTLADERAANGAPDPFAVRYWGIGNESWGCGGHMSAEECAAHFCRYATYFPAYGGTVPALIAVGPESNNLEWTRRFLDAFWKARKYRPPLYAVAMHFYCWGKSTPTAYTPETLREQLAQFDELESAIVQQRALIDSYPVDPRTGRTGLMVDEWGTWDLSDKAVEKEHGLLWQQNTIRDGIAAGLALNVFHRQAEKLVMCNLAQLVNVLQAPLLTRGGECVKTPTYYAFHMNRHHRGRQSVRVESAPPLSVSASRDDRHLAVTIVNPDHAEGRDIRCVIEGDHPERASAMMLHHGDMNACNTFESPGTVAPGEFPVTLAKNEILGHIPPLSLIALDVRLA